MNQTKTQCDVCGYDALEEYACHNDKGTCIDCCVCHADEIDI